MGILEPILRLACWPSVARIRGFWRMRVSVSVSSALRVPPPILTAKLLALILASVLRVKLEGVVVGPVVVLVLVEPGEAWGGRGTDVGKVMPRVRILSGLISRV